MDAMAFFFDLLDECLEAFSRFYLNRSPHGLPFVVLGKDEKLL
jgi:hypothetical protein